jgi:DUF971 family protein
VRPWPTEILIRRSSRRIEIAFDTGERFELPAALLRAMSPSAEAQGHGGDGGPLARDFHEVGVVDAEAIGAYAVRLIFDDGHGSGIFTWALLHRIGLEKEALLHEHRRRLEGAPH